VKAACTGVWEDLEQSQVAVVVCNSEDTAHRVFMQSADLCRMNNSTVTLCNRKVSMSVLVHLSFSFGR